MNFQGESSDFSVHQISVYLFYITSHPILLSRVTQFESNQIELITVGFIEMLSSLSLLLSPAFSCNLSKMIGNDRQPRNSHRYLSRASALKSTSS